MVKEKVCNAVSIFILITSIFSNGCIEFGSDYSYNVISVRIEYPKSNITRAEIMAVLGENNNFSIWDVGKVLCQIKMHNTSTSENELNRMECELFFPSNYHGIELDIEYFSSNPFNEKISSEKEKSKWEKRVDKQYAIDKEILDEYTFSITSFLNDTFDIKYDTIEYSDKYHYEECPSC